jgi:sugar phosphate isomerase/epimerase
MPAGVAPQATIRNIAASLRELGDFAGGYGIEIWVEVYGRETSRPPVMADIMRAAKHEQVGVCWNSNEADIVNGSVKPSFELLKPWLKSVHINELASPAYPWRELFTLLRQAKYERYTLMEARRARSRSASFAGIRRCGRN